MNWRYFAGSIALVAVLLFRAGAPPFAIGAGIALAFGLNLYKARVN
jgi:hypothetical protein